MRDQSDLPVDDGAALAGSLTETGHLLEARVYYANTDFSGTVYHPRYLEFLERGRIEYCGWSACITLSLLKAR
ncbi:hypothetical protein FHS21_003133 [Phyllobacterium trifolii]|uniref:Uncharacterized protein n=1 Tax=Phyllobacterium trifolii TaxID=300193 RepID=A0A839U890_9HYPH|nr:hypothetical protein [Phyllobacterium trifolii]MBB3146717.1 hypothetical protein [Phyllobacterium trifolii]